MRRLLSLLPVSALAFALTSPLTTAHAAEPIIYTLSFPEAQNHYVDVEARLPIEGRTALEVMMPVWTPGSYLVREYARHVEDLRATSESGQALPVVKVRKNRWQIGQLGGASAAVLRYRVYGREMSVRTNWIERDFALLNGAPTYMTLVDDAATRPHEVRIVLPAQWKAVYTALPAVEGRPQTFLASGFDLLIDSPMLLGDPRVERFEAGGKPHLLVDEGGGDLWSTAKAAADVQRIVETQLAFWGGPPYEQYLFLNVIAEARGGLEHLASTVLMTSRWTQRIRDDYLDWLRLVSHEYFHVWNVKRLRPVELGPFDYENENHTRSLWLAEGVTSYYDALLLHRSGLSTVDEYLEMLSEKLDRVQTTPGRLKQSLETASFDAWIEYYRPDENSPNTAISYYDKGALVAWLLDARIRMATGGKKSLDDVMRAAYAKFSGEQGYRTEAFYALASDTAGADLTGWFATAAGGTEELDFAPALEAFGLRFADPKETEPRGWLGTTTDTQAGRVIIQRILRDSPAYTAGLNVGDELIAIGGYRVGPDLQDRLRQYRPGTETEVLIGRRDRLVTLPIVLGTPPAEKWRLELDPKATPAQITRRQAWLVTPPDPANPPKK